MQDHLSVIDEAVRRCTRKVIPTHLLPYSAELRGELGMDSLGLIMLFELLGRRLQIDPVELSRRSTRLVTIGDLVAEVDSLSRR